MPRLSPLAARVRVGAAEAWRIHGRALARRRAGDDVAARVGPIWGFGEEQELRNMFVRTGQPGLWFIAGSFAQCRIYSKYLGLQIAACEAGLLPRRRVASDAPRRSP